MVDFFTIRVYNIRCQMGDCSTNRDFGGEVFTMLAYSIIMFAGFILLLVFSVMIYRGKTNLIHSYHQTRVKDKVGYGKAFGKALSVMALACFVSGVVGLFGDSRAVEMTAVIILIVGMVLGVCCIVAVQHKYNKGVF